MTGIQPGEIIDIAIKGVRAVGEDRNGCVSIIDEHGHHYDMPPQAAIKRVAPPEWPPRLGDLWRDRFGDLWFGSQGYGPDNEHYVAFQCAVTKHLESWGPQAAADANRLYGPLTLVHREQQPKETS